jgi:Galactose oxidase, central domain
LGRKVDNIMNIKAVIRTWSVVIVAVAACAGICQAKCVPHVPKAGDVLVTGGEDINENATGNTEFFDPGTGIWMTGCPTKSQHDEAQIAVTGGQILVIGGESLKGHSKATDIYSPSTGRFGKKAKSMKVAREDFVAVTLNDGSVLAVGGFDKHENPLSTAELFKGGKWKLLAQKTTVARGAHCGAIMTGGSKSGQVLIAGGTSADENSPNLNSAEVFDPATGAFTATNGNMNFARAYAVATALPDGTVLITGGIDDNLNARNTAEIYNPDTGDFTQTANNMSIGRVDHSATLLPDGTVLIAGGETSYQAATTKLNTAEIYDPGTAMFSDAMVMNDHRDDNTATLISGSGTALDGQVLIEGGFFNLHGESTAEVYDPVMKTFTATSAMNFAHGEASAALIP